MSNMRSRFVLLLLFATVANGGEVTRAARWEFHSSVWMNLHQRLIHDVRVGEKRDVGALTGDERAVWDAAIAVYRKETGGDPFARPAVILQDDLAQIADDATNPAIDGALADAIRKAAPVYRVRWWPEDDAANRFFIAYASAMIRDTGEELVRAHEAIYHESMPKSIRVDITKFAEPFGAYTVSLIDSGAVTTMSTSDPGYQGLAAVEMLLHEASHTIVGPRSGTVARAIADASAKLGIQPSRDLWHAILFATSSELAKRALAARGVTTYVPSSNDMFTRVWPKYRQAIETYWYPYLSGSGTLEDAIAKIVAAVK